MDYAARENKTVSYPLRHLQLAILQDKHYTLTEYKYFLKDPSPVKPRSTKDVAAETSGRNNKGSSSQWPVRENQNSGARKDRDFSGGAERVLFAVVSWPSRPMRWTCDIK